MTVDEVKNELKRMDGPVLKEITSFILELRRSQDPRRRQAIFGKLDGSDVKWLTLDDLDERLERE